jgi:DNA-binding CsgD family transcriptional regulator
MTATSALKRGRESYRRQAWADAVRHLSDADQERPLAPDDLEQLAIAAELTGRDGDAIEPLERAHQEYLRRDDNVGAGRCAFWIGFRLMNMGEFARGGGWLSRARRLLEEADCAERGYLFLPMALQSLDEGDADAAHAAFERALECGERFRDADLTTLGRLGMGQSLLRLGDVTPGLELLDEAMVAVTTGEVSPLVVGITYCAVIEACHEIFDIGRARQWTEALSRWTSSQPDLAAFRGQCSVYRAEIMQLHGDWEDAIAEAERACERLMGPPGHPAAGSAYYQRAELHRLRGEFVKAEEAYRQASQWGCGPNAGIARLRLAQGQVDVAAANIRRLVDEAQDRVTRSRLLAAHAEIMLEAGDSAAARAAADELEEIAAGFRSPMLRALGSGARGAVLLADGDARAAVAPLRESLGAWREIGAPYESARVRMLIAAACRELGDDDSARMELDAARAALERLGAAPDLARIDAMLGKAETGGLSEREVEVLRLIARGKTNRAIADELVISEKTVARHVSNIFAKLGLSSRSAATAYAYEHGLLAH